MLAAVQEKISLHSGSGIDAILEVVDKSSIPVELGGSCTDCNGECMPKSIRNIDFIPSASGDREADSVESNRDLLESVLVGAGKTHEHVVHTGTLSA